MHTQDIKKHLSLTNKEQIMALCQPLVKHLRVKSLVYKFLQDDGTETVLTTHPEWLDYYYNNRLYLENILEKEPSNYVKGELLWSQIKTHGNILGATREKFAIDNGLTLIRPHMNGCEFFYFGADKLDYRAGQLLINNVDLLDKFIHYFKNRASNAINKATRYPLRLDNRFVDNIRTLQDIPCYQNQAMRANFLEELYRDGIDLNLDGQSIHLTKREFQIAEELITGKTLEQIGKVLFISARTVETHLENIKQKFSIRKKSELMMLLAVLLN